MIQVPKISPKVLLATGFNPFQGHKTNSSWEALSLLGARNFHGLELRSFLLETEYKKVESRLLRMLNAHRPLAAVHFGLSAKATGLVLETSARNEVRESLDNAGYRPTREELPPGPERLECQLDVPQLVERLRDRGVPARASSDAGRFVCEFTYYRSLAFQWGRVRPAPVLFVHVPALGGEWRGVDGEVTSVDWFALAEAMGQVLDLVAECAQRPVVS